MKYNSKGRATEWDKSIYVMAADGESLWCRLCGRWAHESHISAPKHKNNVDSFKAEPWSWKPDDFKEMPPAGDDNNDDNGDDTGGMGGNSEDRRLSDIFKKFIPFVSTEIEAALRDAYALGYDHGMSKGKAKGKGTGKVVPPPSSSSRSSPY